MNERIRELDQQAVDYANNVCDANGIYKGKEYLTVVKEKFAELIVRECLTICDEVQCQYGQYTFTATTVKDRVIQHFGVKS